MLKRAALLALTLGAMGVMTEAEVENVLLPIAFPVPAPVPIPAPVPQQTESLAVKAVEEARVQEMVDIMQHFSQLDKKLQEDDKRAKRSEVSNEPQRSEEPRQPEAVAKPNLPSNAPTPPKQVVIPPRTKPAFNRSNQSKEEEPEETEEKPQSKDKKGKNKKGDDNENEKEDFQPSKTNYTVPKRRSQTQQRSGAEESVPGSVIGALVLFLVVALMQ